MALIKCSECGHEVSTKSRACPQCGNPLKPSNNVVMTVLKAVVLVVASLWVIGWLVSNNQGTSNSVTQATSVEPSGASTSSGSGSSLTLSQRSAIAAAKSYLATSSFSKQGLIDQLDSAAGSGFSARNAKFAVDSLRVNWDFEAARAAKQYLQTSPFSCQGMVQQLSSSAGGRFTMAQAEYGAEKVGLCSHGTSSGSTLTVSQQNAIADAKEYLATSAFSKRGLIDQLDSSSGSSFSAGDATFAVESLHVNWDSEAAKAAKEYLQTSSFSCQGMIQQLSSSAGSKFTRAQAAYGAKEAGLC